MKRLHEFNTSDNTTSYVSETVHQSPYGNRTTVFQATVNAGDTVVLQGRISADFNWIDIITITDGSVLMEVVTAPMYRVVVTNTSGSAVVAAMSI